LSIRRMATVSGVSRYNNGYTLVVLDVSNDRELVGDNTMLM